MLLKFHRQAPNSRNVTLVWRWTLMSRFAIGIAHGSSGVSVIQGFLTKCLTEILNDSFLADAMVL